MVKQAVVLLFLVGQVLYSLAVVVDINVKLSELGAPKCKRLCPPPKLVKCKFGQTRQEIKMTIKSACLCPIYRCVAAPKCKVCPMPFIRCRPGTKPVRGVRLVGGRCTCPSYQCVQAPKCKLCPLALPKCRPGTKLVRGVRLVGGRCTCPSYRCIQAPKCKLCPLGFPKCRPGTKLVRGVRRVGGRCTCPSYRCVQAPKCKLCPLGFPKCRPGTKLVRGVRLVGGRCTCPSYRCVPVDPCRRPCPMIYAPVCGSDGKTYPNECVLKIRACIIRMRLVVDHKGKCEGPFTPGPRPTTPFTPIPRPTTKPAPPCVRPCPKIYKPVCGSDGNTYPNECTLRIRACIIRMRLEVDHDGPCEGSSPPPPPVTFPVETVPDTTPPLPPISETVTETAPPCKRRCQKIYKPVCGSNGKTYPNDCVLKYKACILRMRLEVDHNGPCRGSSPPPPPVTIPIETEEPVVVE